MISVIHPIPNSGFGHPTNGAQRGLQYYGSGPNLVDSMISFQSRSRGYTHHVAPAPQVHAWTQQHQQQQRAVNQSSRGLSIKSISEKKDFSKPLFVDCSIEYELPNAPKIPKNSQPILMIHPGFHQKQMQQKHYPPMKICSVPNCQCKVKPGTKRSFSNAMNNNNDYFHQQHLQQQLTTATTTAAAAAAQQQKSIAGYHSFEASSEATNAKRSRLMYNQQQQQQQQQMFQHAQMQAAAAALRHYHQYAAAAAAVSRPKLQRPDMRISSFQQITPPESLAFWQQQHASAVATALCRSACCAPVTSRAASTTAGATYLNYSPPLVGLQHAGGQQALPPPCCYALPPTPMPMGTAGGYCISCAQGKCQVNVNKENLGIMRSL